MDGQPVVVPNARGSFTTPSVVSFKVRSGKKKRGHDRGPSSSSAAAAATGQRRISPSSAARKRRRAPTPPAAASGDPDLDYDYYGDSSGGGGRSSRPTAAGADRRGAGGKQEAVPGAGAGGGAGAGADRGGGGGGLARIYVGEAAVERIATHPRTTYSSVKRIVGRTKREAKEAGVGLGALNVDQVLVPGLVLACLLVFFSWRGFSPFSALVLDCPCSEVLEVVVVFSFCPSCVFRRQEWRRGRYSCICTSEPRLCSKTKAKVVRPLTARLKAG